MPEPSGSTGAQPSAEAIEATAMCLGAALRPYFPAIDGVSYSVARRSLIAALAIDAPAIHSRGYEEGRAAGRDQALREVVALLREADTQRDASRGGTISAAGFADLIEAAFPTTGQPGL